MLLSLVDVISVVGDVIGVYCGCLMRFLSFPPINQPRFSSHRVCCFCLRAGPRSEGTQEVPEIRLVKTIPLLFERDPGRRSCRFSSESSSRGAGLSRVERLPAS